jgi:hypothetical protein
MIFTTGALLFMLLAYANRDILLARYFSDGPDDQGMWAFSLNFIGSDSQKADISYDKEHLTNANFWLIILVYPTVLGMFLPLINFFFTALSIKLNNFENYRTDTEYRNHLILKVFTFRFVNYFVSQRARARASVKKGFLSLERARASPSRASASEREERASPSRASEAARRKGFR